MIQMDVDGPAPLNGNAMMIDTGLADIFRQSEEMWKRKNLTKQPMGAASAISALKTSKDMSQLSITALSEPSPLQKEQKKDVTVSIVCYSIRICKFERKHKNKKLWPK